MWSYRRNFGIHLVLLCTLFGAIVVLVDISAILRHSNFRWLLPKSNIIGFKRATLRHENDDDRTDSRTNTQLQQQELLKRTLDTITPGVGQITHLRLVNANSNNIGQPLIDPLVNGTIINLQNYPANQQFSIEAMVSNTTGPIGSIRFVNVDGKKVTDNFVRYASCGDKKGSFNNCSALSIVGTNYSISATPHSQSNASGVAGATHTIYFSVVNNPTIAPSVGEITHLRLVNANSNNSGQPLIDPLVNGTIINLQNYPSNQQFAVEAMVSNTTGPIGSIRFVNVDGKRVTDNFVRYASCGDKKGSFNNCSALSIVGTNYSISATPHSQSNASGVAGATHTIYFSVVNNTSPPRWVIVNPAAPIVKRHESCFVLVGRNAYVVAGRAKRNVEIYNLINRTWSLGAKPPIQLHHSQCVVADNKIWIVSSWTGGYPRETNTDAIYIYDPATDKWSTKPGLPESRRRGGAASVLVGRRIYVSHGNRGGHETGNFSTSLNWLDYYDIDLNLWVTNLTNAPHVRDHTGGVYVNGEICVAGGRDGGSKDFFNQVVLPTDCYNPVTGTWTVRANIPQGRAGSAYGLTCDGKMMVAGGEGLGHAWSNVDIFNGTHWTLTDPLNIARHGTGLAIDCTCNQVHIAAGSIVQGGRYETTSVETYFPNGVDVPCLA